IVQNSQTFIIACSGVMISFCIVFFSGQLRRITFFLLDFLVDTWLSRLGYEENGLRNAIIIVVIIGMIGWAIYGFIDKQSNTALIDSNDAETTEVNDAEQVEVADGEGEVKKEKMSTAGAPQQMGFEPGEEAPDFELETMDGEPAKLSDYRGQKVLLNFWATWCPPCRDEIPDMQAFHEDYGDDVAVLAV